MEYILVFILLVLCFVFWCFCKVSSMTDEGEKHEED